MFRNSVSASNCANASSPGFGAHGQEALIDPGIRELRERGCVVGHAEQANRQPGPSGIGCALLQPTDRCAHSAADLYYDRHTDSHREHVGQLDRCQSGSAAEVVRVAAGLP